LLSHLAHLRISPKRDDVANRWALERKTSYLKNSLTKDEQSTRKGFDNLKRGIDYIGVGVGAIIVNEEDCIFLARRGPKAKNEQGLWEFPGGSVEFGETLTEALQREMHEEYGIEVSVGKLVDVVDHILHQEHQHWVSPTFICQIQSGEPYIREPEKCTEIGWFSVDHVPHDLTKITKLNLEHYLQIIAKTNDL